MRIRILIAAMALFSFQPAFGQTDGERAAGMIEQAVYMMDNGNPEGAVNVLEEARKLDPDNITISYEIALAYCIQKDYARSIKILQPLKKHKDFSDQFFQMLGNCYSIYGERAKAIKTYEEGLKRFPGSGRLYLELGNVELIAENYNDAMSYYESGIKSDPTFPSNYYRAARMFCNSSDRIWGILYGELFMNLERTTQRTMEMSEMLYDTYDKSLQFEGDSVVTTSFSNLAVLIASLLNRKNPQMPFSLIAYEAIISLAVAGERNVDISSLDRIRTRFVEIYYEKGKHLEYPNALFDYQKKILDAGHMEAYNHWLLIEGDRDGFDRWYEDNSEKFEAFLEWYERNPIELSVDNKFYRTQYLLTMEKKKLTDYERHIIIDKGTEPPFTGEYCDLKGSGIYLCRQCGTPLYRSVDKFSSGCGWPSFDDEIEGTVKRTPDPDGRRTEITCARCGGHLGHVFEGEGFTPKNTRHCVNSVSLTFVPDDKPAGEYSDNAGEPGKAGVNPHDPEVAYFAGGCFWGVEHLMQKQEGVISVESGYMGGHVENPDYEQVCKRNTGHAEVVKVTYDPDRVSYLTLAKLFFEIHDPTQEGGQGPDIGDQYRSEIFYTSLQQKATAERLIKMLKQRGYDVVTDVTPASEFWKAEDYHQDYYERKGTQPYCHKYTKRFD